MYITDWNKWMKDHHIKIYTEEELQRKRMKETVKKACRFVKKHKKEFLEALSAQHA